MRSAAFLLLVWSSTGAHAAVIASPLVREGLEIAPGLESQTALDHQPGPLAADSVFLVADVHATKEEAHGFGEHAFIPYLSISYSLAKEGAPTYKNTGLLYPVAGRGGPHYAGAAEMAGPGTYHLTYIISPPSAHGMLRQTGKENGVPDWWKPITASWNFTYPATNTLSAK